MKQNILMLMVICGLTLSANAHAYLDPGTGSYILQILLGGLAAGYFLIKQYWLSFKAFLFRKGQKQEENE